MNRRRNILHSSPLDTSAIALPLLLLLYCVSPLPAQNPTGKPTWCRQLPRPEFARLERVPLADSWFEVYKVAPRVFAIYEPHQSEETIGYLILGSQRALLF